jgi:two-component system sensor histidine kinase and response regulator WspE
MSRDDYLGSSLFDMFQADVGGQVQSLASGLLAAERGDGDLERMMRAAHSIKGAARVVGVEPAVQVAHAMEECFVVAQKKNVTLGSGAIDILLRACDLLGAIATTAERELPAFATTRAGELAAILRDLAQLAVDPTHGGKSARVSDGPSLIAMFADEIRSRLPAIDEALNGLATDSSPRERLDSLMTSIDSVRAAARIVNLDVAIRLADAIDQVVLALQEKELPVTTDAEAVLKRGRDELAMMAKAPPSALERHIEREAPRLEMLIGLLDDLRQDQSGIFTAPTTMIMRSTTPATATPAGTKTTQVSAPVDAGPARLAASDRFVRVATGNLDRLLGLAGETLVEARTIGDFVIQLDRIRAQQTSLGDMLSRLDRGTGVIEPQTVVDMREGMAANRRAVAGCRGELEDLARRFEEISARLYRAAIATRMRPFADGASGFGRLVRDLARKLERQVELVIVGEDTPVDRDILDRMEAALNHMVRNAVDHGIEAPAERIAAGKTERGKVRLEARHSAGVLSLTVADDGRGIDVARIRGLVSQRGLLDERAASVLSDAQAIEYIFMSGFSTASEVTEISGRGVGLDVVRSTVQELGGSVRTMTEPGKGTSFHVQLPLTRSVTRAVVVEIAGEPYAFPLLRTDRLLNIPSDQLRIVEGRQYVVIDGENVGLVQARQVLDLSGESKHAADGISIVVVSDRAHRVAVEVDRVLGEQDLVVHPLDARLGRVADISSAAVTAGGEPLLIIDVEDLVRSVVRLLAAGSAVRVERDAARSARGRRQVLVVDDSLTVREVHRQILASRGYDVTVAVDGVAAWNLIRDSSFDLVVTDIDMPRMNGFDLVRSIKQDPRLHSTPVIVVSYKERPEDRARGLEVGADYYLGKGDFHDDALASAVLDLIGEAT